jgi:hypothetical protein
MLTDLNNVERHLALRIAGNLAQYCRTHLKNEGFTLDGSDSVADISDEVFKYITNVPADQHTVYHLTMDGLDYYGDHLYLAEAITEYLS